MKALIASAAVSLGLLAGCAAQQDGHAPHGSGHPMKMDAAPKAAMVKNAVAVVHPLGASKVMGVVRFVATDEGVKVSAEISGLTPGSKHAFHVHEFGDCSDPQGKSAGGHYNPDKHQHGAPDADPTKRHPGDMGNLSADDKGVAKLEVTLAGTTLTGEKNPIVGRAVIIHAKPDDFSQPVGNAGDRIGCGVIGIAESK